mgnify:FL=1
MNIFSPDCIATTAFMFFMGVLFCINLYMVNSVLKHLKRSDKKQESTKGQIPVYIDESGNMKIQEFEIQDEGRMNPDEDLHKWSD